MNVLFVKEGCPYCLKIKEVVIALNSRLPIHKKIQIVNYFAGSNINRILDMNKARAVFPTLVLEVPVTIRVRNMVKVIKKKIFMYGAEDPEYVKEFILGVLNEQ